MNASPLLRRKVLFLNGPNLNLLGERDPHLYGTTTLDAVVKGAVALAAESAVDLTAVQSNLEGELVTALQDGRHHFDGAILNPGPLSHYGLSLRDVIDVIDIPVIEIHISNIYAREEYRRTSVISPVAAGVVCGFGVAGYRIAVRAMIELLDRI